MTPPAYEPVLLSPIDEEKASILPSSSKGNAPLLPTHEGSDHEQQVPRRPGWTFVVLRAIASAVLVMGLYKVCREGSGCNLYSRSALCF